MGSALRDLNPCVCYRGQLLTAPADSDEIFALSAASGEWLWGNALPDDVTDLLGVGGGNLIASGKRLWWLDARHGNVVWCWPEDRASGLQPRGRGLLVGAHVYWPTVDSIRILPDQPTSRTREVREAIRLDQLGAQGGNLAAVDGYLLIAGPDKLVGLVNESRPVESSARDIARRRTHPER